MKLKQNFIKLLFKTLVFVKGSYETIYEYYFEPIEDLLGGYSETLGYSFNNLVKAVALCLFLFIFQIILAIYFGLFEKGTSVINLVKFEFISLIRVSLAFCSIYLSSFFVSNIKSVHSKNFVRGRKLIYALAGITYAIGALTLETPLLYGLLFIALYALGSYVSTNIEFLYHAHPMPINNIKGLKSMMRKNLVVMLVIGIVYSGLIYENFFQPISYIRTEYYVSVMFIFSMALTVFQYREIYKDIFKFSRLRDTSSQDWLFLPRCVILSSLIFSFLNPDIAHILSIGFFTPILSYSIFYIYTTLKSDSIVDYGDFLRPNNQRAIENQVDMVARTAPTAGEINISAKANTHDKETDVEVNERFSKVEFSIDSVIPKPMPDMKKAWHQQLMTYYHILKLLEIHDDKTSDKMLRDYKNFLNEGIEAAVDSLSSHDDYEITTDKYPPEIRGYVMKYTDTEETMQDIIDSTQLESTEPISKNYTNIK